MTIESARFMDADHILVSAEIDGVEMSFPRSDDNRMWQRIVRERASVAPYMVPAPDIGDVRAEAARRMRLLVGARDAAHLEIKIANASREAIRLLRLRMDREWTADEAMRAAVLDAADKAIEAIRAAGNTLEAMSPVPADFADDKWWP